MRTDPNTACANEEERARWAFVHDAISHPLMALTRWSKASLCFHDWTSRKAWPRPVEAAPASGAHYSRALGCMVTASALSTGDRWEIVAPDRSMRYGCVAKDALDALVRAEAWWRQYASEFEGNRTPITVHPAQER